MRGRGSRSFVSGSDMPKGVGHETREISWQGRDRDGRERHHRAKALGLKIPQTLLLRTDRRRRSEGLTSERDQRTICSLVQLACS